MELSEQRGVVVAELPRPARAVAASRAQALIAGSAVLAMGVATLLAAATGWNRNLWLALPPRLAMVGLCGFVGVWAMLRPVTAQFGRVLVLVGLLGGVSMLNGSSNPAVYSLGRATVPFLEVGLTYAVLAFPSGRLVLRRDRIIVAVMLGLIACFWGAAVLTSSRFKVGGPMAACGHRCPRNVLTVVQEPGLAAALDSLVFLAAFGCMIAAGVSLALRYREASPVLRRGLSVVTAAGLFYAAALATFAVLSVFAPHSPVTAVFGWVNVGANLVFPVAFAVALLRERLFAGEVLRSLIRELMRAPDAVTFRQAIAEVVGDPSLRLAHRTDAGSLIDLRGQPLPDLSTSGRIVTPVAGAGDGLLLIHDVALEEDVELFDAVCEALAVAYDQSRQRIRVAELVDALQSSRERLAATRDAERRRFERDLHDGAQQGFVAARMRLGIARTKLESGSDDADAFLGQAAAQLDQAIHQLRELARGIYPSTLESDGVVAALRGAASLAALPTTVRVDGGVGRFSQEVEAAVYFCCLEAMQNASKHAGEGARVRVAVSEAGGAVEFSVSDDGPGFDPDTVANLGGLLNIQDRVEPLGGSATIDSAPGGGTTVTGRIPLTP